MGPSYLLDTNTVIYYLHGRLPEKSAAILDEYINVEINLSIISKIELLCWNTDSISDYRVLETFIDESVIWELGANVVNETIEIRKKHRLKLPDAIIAATARVHEFILITRNTSDFARIPNLQLLDPFQLA
ncbi:MAG: type II toxin-antitoxin system VapC family toxin [Bacteroidetes bacterium]|nr:MAG: type II toxin-antitoxin system VapC family toxin [Bacteroidota bacterium]